MVIDTKKIKETINLNPGKTKKELAGILGIKHETFIYHYKKLLKNNEINKIEDQAVITESKIKTLEYYFTCGFTDEEACLEADISTRTLYNYCTKNPEWAEKRQLLKRKPIMRAKLLVNKNLEEGKDEFVKMVYQEDKRQERAKIKVDLWVTTEDEEEANVKQVSLNVTFSD